MGSNIRLGNNYLLYQCMECVFFGSHFDFTDGWSEAWNQEISRAVRHYSASDRIFDSFPTVPEPQYSQFQASHQLTAKFKMAFKEKQIRSNLCLNIIYPINAYLPILGFIVIIHSIVVPRIILTKLMSV